MLLGKAVHLLYLQINWNNASLWVHQNKEKHYSRAVFITEKLSVFVCLKCVLLCRLWQDKKHSCGLSVCVMWNQWRNVTLPSRHWWSKQSPVLAR